MTKTQKHKKRNKHDASTVEENGMSKFHDSSFDIYLAVF